LDYKTIIKEKMISFQIVNFFDHLDTVFNTFSENMNFLELSNIGTKLSGKVNMWLSGWLSKESFEPN
jgi:hypothetical protein